MTSRIARGALVALGIFFLATVAAAAEMNDSLSQDFRREFTPQWFRLMGGDAPTRYCRRDSKGVRCTIPAGDASVTFCGLDARVVVRGDFEITASYEIVELPKPTKGQGAGLKISIKDAAQEAASVQRLSMVGTGHGYSSHRAIPDRDGKLKHTSEIRPTQATKGRLRLKRSGSTLHYLVADGDSETFSETRQAEFTTGDLSQVYFVAQTGGSPTKVDVLWTGIDIRAEKLVRSFEAQSSPHWVTWAAGIAVVGAMALVAVAWIRLRRGRR